MAECLLRMEHITKKFGVFTANRDISLTLHEGEVLTLLGENGAGKSTLMNVLCGLYHPTEGKIFLHGQEVRLTSPASAVQRGIGMVHQHFMLVEAMTVFQNIILGLSQERSVLIHAGKLRAQIQALSEKYGLEISLDQKITELSVGAQQRVEILKALWRGAEILILDEPTAVLTDEETEGLFAIIRRLQQEGKGILFISHKLREVMAISDRILVLRRGEAVAEITDMTQANEQTLASTMVGSQVETCIYEKSTAQAAPILELRQVCYHAASKHNGLDHVDLDLRPGEILGIAGVDGNGQSQLAQAVTGLLTPESGQIVFHGQTVTRFDPGWFIRRQVAHIPEDRNRMGLAGAMSIQENLMMKLLPGDRRVRWRGWGLKPARHRPLCRNDTGKIRHPLPQHSAASGQSLRRQPAEGHPGPGAGAATGCPHRRAPHSGAGYRRSRLCPRVPGPGKAAGLCCPADLCGSCRNSTAGRPDRRLLRGAHSRRF